MKKLLVLLFFVAAGKVMLAQTDVTEYIKAGAQDAEKLMKAYLNPYALALGDGMNNGWYYTAETHHRLGFDFSMSISMIRIPESAKTFDIGSMNFESIVLDNPTNTIAQTAAGEKVLGPKLNLLDPNNPGDTLGSFRSPPGVGVEIVPLPVAQLGIGLLPHTDLLIRYMPKLHFNQKGDEDEDVKVGLLGVGVKHSFKDWLPAIKHFPFDAAVFAAYSRTSANTGIDFQLNDYGFSNPPGYIPDENQQLDILTNTLKMGLIVSKDLAFITFFGGIGNSRNRTHVDLLGRYPVVTNYSLQGIEVKDEVDPVKMRFNSSQLSLDAGLRMKLAFFNVFASVNKSEYTSLNAGVSLAVR